MQNNFILQIFFQRISLFLYHYFYNKNVGAITIRFYFGCDDIPAHAQRLITRI